MHAPVPKHRNKRKCGTAFSSVRLCEVISRSSQACDRFTQ